MYVYLLRYVRVPSHACTCALFGDRMHRLVVLLYFSLGHEHNRVLDRLLRPAGWMEARLFMPLLRRLSTTTLADLP